MAIPQRRLAPEHERVFVCTVCEQAVLVCGYVADIDPAAFVGLACGCRLRDRSRPPSAAVEAAGRARTAQQEAKSSQGVL